MNRVALASLLLLSFPSFAQKIIYGNATIGNYWMGDMKQKQQEFEADYAKTGIPARAVSSFPISLQGELGMVFTVHNSLLHPYHIGGFINFAVTKARINYADYSGSVDLIQDLKRFVLGAKGMHGLTETLDLYGKAGVCFSDIRFKSNMSLQSGAVSSEDIRFNATGLTLEAGIQWTKVYHRLRFMAHTGYELNINGKSMFGENNNYLIDNNGDPVKVDWSGFRAGIGIGVALKKN